MYENDEIQGIQTHHLDNPTHYELMKTTVEAAKSDAGVMKLVRTLVGELDTAVQAEEQVLKTPQKDPLTDQIKQADDDRNAEYTFIRNTVKINLKNAGESERQAAESVELLIGNYHIKISDQYDRKTGLMENLLNDAERKYTTEFARLGLTTHLKALRTHNNRFIQLLDERTKGKSQLTTGATVKARAATDEVFTRLRKSINGLIAQDGGETVAAFVNFMNVELNRLKQQVLHKHGVEINGGGDSGNNNDGGEEEPPQG
ncbi:MAG: DUF6261 family protein [Prevotellaceae bacterium]|nr:DUF6261 family protein [Prevotellaceae bacterium]